MASVGENVASLPESVNSAVWALDGQMVRSENMNPIPPPAIGDLYPDFSKEQLAETKQILEKYLALVLRIFERTESEPNPQANHLTRYTGTLPCTPPLPESSV